MTEAFGPQRNWASTYTYRAEKLHRPGTVEEVQQIVANAVSVHALGSRHSFNTIADSSELISLEALPAEVVGSSALPVLSRGLHMRSFSQQGLGSDFLVKLVV